MMRREEGSGESEDNIVARSNGADEKTRDGGGGGLWRRDGPPSGTQEACQGLNDITLHVIYFMALGGCLVCQEMHKNHDCDSSPSPRLTHKHTRLTLQVWHQTKCAQHTKLSNYSLFQWRRNNCFGPQDNPRK